MQTNKQDHIRRSEAGRAGEERNGPDHTMTERRLAEHATFPRVSDLGSLEVLRVRYITHSFARQAHDSYSIGVIEARAGAYISRGETHVTREGSVFAIHLGEVDDSYGAADLGWTYSDYSMVSTHRCSLAS
jgi:hypothetical protein